MSKEGSTMDSIEYITYNGNDYPTRWVHIKSFGERLISTTALSSVLLDDSYNYVSDEARCVDELIFYFVKPEVTQRHFWQQAAKRLCAIYIAHKRKSSFHKNKLMFLTFVLTYDKL
jgi:hypothetical protein